MTNQEILILFLMLNSKRMGYIHGLVRLLHSVDRSIDVIEVMTYLKENEYIAIEKNKGRVPVKYTVTHHGKKALKKVLNVEEFRDYINEMPNPSLLYQMTKVIFKNNYAQKL